MTHIEPINQVYAKIEQYGGIKKLCNLALQECIDLLKMDIQTHHINYCKCELCTMYLQLLREKKIERHLL